MGTGREDFTKDTIRRAAGRVAYRCSFPGCCNETIGVSMEGSDKTALLVLLHIFALLQKVVSVMIKNDGRGTKEH